MSTEAWLEGVEREAVARTERLSPRSPRTLTVLFDPNCVLCLRCRSWMLSQPSYIELKFVPCTEAQARDQFGYLPWLGDELVVVGDGGEIWIGPAAFLTCLWALIDWRSWSYTLSAPSFAGLAERFFHNISNRRSTIAAFIKHDDDCTDGTCHVGNRR